MPDEPVVIPGVDAALGTLLYEVCGPTAKYLGGEARSYAEAGIANLKKIFGHANRKIRLLEKDEGQVPPRVLYGVFTAGYFCEDELGAAYLGGVLASAKGPVSRDDRAVSYLEILGGLSTYQIRTHFILYSALLRVKAAQVRRNEQPPGFSEVSCWLTTQGVTVALSEDVYLQAMEFTLEEDLAVITEHSFIGLEKKGLSEGGTRLVQPHPNIPSISDTPSFRFFYPTTLGVELFLWGLGYGDKGLDAYQPELLEAAPAILQVDPLFVELGRVSW